MTKFRDLRPDEIELRVSRCNKNGVALLAYKTARVDANILDETLGVENWQCRFYEVCGSTFCSIGIKVPETGEWVWKDDCGSAGDIEKEKSLASSAFKRAGFKLGIGRELYTAPFIFVPSGKCNIKQNGQRFQCYDHFSVAKIQIEGGEITGLRINNDTTGGVAFSWKR